MNPLNRKMFRQPGMSRQPAGILASSPELANVVRQRMDQPVQMANGGINANDTISNQLMAIQQLRGMGDKATLTNIARDQRLPRSVQMAAANALSGIKPKESGPVQQVPLASTGKLPSLSAPPVMSVRGNSGQRQPADPQKQTSLDSQVMSGSSMPLEALNRIRKARGMSVLPSTTDPDIFVRAARKLSPDGKGIAAVLGENQAETQRLISQANEQSDILRDPTMLVPQLTRPDIERAFTDPDEIFEGEKLAKNKVTSETPVILSPPVVEQIVTGTEGFDEDGADMNLLEPTGQNLSDAAKDLLNRPSLSAEAVNKRVDELLGIDSAIQEKTGKPATKKERIKAEVAILKEALGEDAAKDIRTSGAYNLMMTGLMIAAGDSPDAMTNIVKGLAGGLKMYGDATGEEAQRKNKLEQSLGLQAYSNVREEIAAEKIADVKLREQKASLAGQIYLNEANNVSAMERLVAKEGFDAGRFQKTLKLQTDQLEQQLKIANMPPADIRTLTMIQQQPQLLEIMEQAAVAKDPTKLERDILGHLLKSPYFAMELTEEGGQQKLAGYATTLANSFRTAREQGDSEAGTDAKPPLTGAAAQAHIDANAAAKKAGQSTYTINGQPHKVK